MAPRARALLALPKVRHWVCVCVMHLLIPFTYEDFSIFVSLEFLVLSLNYGNTVKLITKDEVIINLCLLLFMPKSNISFLIKLNFI